MVRARTELANVVQQAGVDAHALPALVDRPQSTPPKLIDEHDYVLHTLGHHPPTREKLERWPHWF